MAVNMQKTRMQSDRFYNKGRDWAKEGGTRLLAAKKETRAGKFADARNDLQMALASFEKAIVNYELALGRLPNPRFQRKIQGKMDGLIACDVRFAQKTLKHVELKLAPPMKNEGKPPKFGGAATYFISGKELI